LTLRVGVRDARIHFRRAQFRRARPGGSSSGKKLIRQKTHWGSFPLMRLSCSGLFPEGLSFLEVDAGVPPADA
jgi:hypothetical protein